MSEKIAKSIEVMFNVFITSALNPFYNDATYNKLCSFLFARHSCSHNITHGMSTGANIEVHIIQFLHKPTDITAFDHTLSKQCR